MTTNDVLLHATQISRHYGDFIALHNVDLSVSRGEFVSVVGPNGAGKTTLVNVLTGLHQPTTGNVHFNGSNIAGVGAVDLATRGLARAFQLTSIFSRADSARNDRGLGMLIPEPALERFRPFIRQPQDQRYRGAYRRCIRPVAMARYQGRLLAARSSQAARRRQCFRAASESHVAG